jgi:hypothetical protein
MSRPLMGLSSIVVLLGRGQQSYKGKERWKN